MRWKDVNTNELTVKGKGDKIRSVPLNKEALKILDKQPRKDEFVFDVPNRSQPWDILQGTVNSVREESKVSIFRFHLLRHFFATSFPISADSLSPYPVVFSGSSAILA